MIPIADLVNVTGIAARANVCTSTVSRWRARHEDTFPEAIPAYGAAGFDLWSWPEVRAWLIATKRLRETTP